MNVYLPNYKVGKCVVFFLRLKKTSRYNLVFKKILNHNCNYNASFYLNFKILNECYLYLIFDNMLYWELNVDKKNPYPLQHKP